jgi:hypothetical protein
VAYLEKVIREELGFVKPGEIVYELVTTKNPKNHAPASAGSVVTPYDKTTSVSQEIAPKKATLSPVQVVASLANSTPKVPNKKISSISR